MTNQSIISELYCTALPSVRDRPLQTMPKTLYAYVWRVSGRQQVPLCLLTLLVFPLTLVPLELQRRIVNGAVGGEDMSLLFLLGAVYLAVIIGRAVLKYVRNIYLERVSAGITRILRMRIAHSKSYGTMPDEGTKQAIISSEAEKVGGFVAEAIAFPFLNAGIVLSVAGYMIVVEPIIATVAIAFLVPSVIVVAVSQPVLNRISEKMITVARELGQCVISEGRDEAGPDPDPDGFIDRIYQLRLRFAATKHLAKAISNLINHMGPLSVLVVGGWLVIQGQTEVGTIVAFMSGHERMTEPAGDLLNFYRRLAMMRVQYRLIYSSAQSSEAGES